MTQDELEFLIVQRVDGTLSTDEATRLSAALTTDASARDLLAQHERLATALRATPSMTFDADWLASQIATRIDDDADFEASRTFKLPRWSLFAPMAAAAALLVVLTLGVVYHRDDGEKIARPDATPTAPIVVASFAGPTAESTNAPRQMSVSVGAPSNLSPTMVTALFLAEQFPTGGRVIVRPAGPPSSGTAFD